MGNLILHTVHGLVDDMGKRFYFPFAKMDCMETENKTISDRKNEERPFIEIKALFFARARDLTGQTQMPLKVSCGSTAHDCLNKLVAEFPGLKEIRDCMVLAINEEYASESAVVKERDELAIIPPISGG